MADPVQQASPVLSRRATSGPVPLSFAQQRLWFLDQLEPNSPFYNVPMALHLTGPLDLAALHRSLDTIVARHEALRTTFAAKDGKPSQIISAAKSVELPLVTMPPMQGPAQEDAILRIANEEAGQPFDLARGPLLRARLFQLGPDEHVLVLVMHHIVSDGWSTAVLFRELSECYRAFQLGEAPRLPDLPVQYADYAVWQQAWLQGERLEEQLGYWQSQLAAVPPVLELPTDRPRPAIQTYRGARRRKSLPDSLSRGLTALGRQEHATPFMVLLAAFHVLLSRYTGRRDIVVGAPIAGRTHLKVEGLIGLFVNTLALRCDLSGDPTFRDFLGRVRGVAVGAYAHQELPFERLVEALQPERSRQHAPLVQVLLAFHNTPPARLSLPGLAVRRLRITGRTAKFDLSLVLRPHDSSLEAEVEYSSDLFEAATIARLLDNFETLLHGIMADPGRRLSALPLLTEAERRRVVVEWNAVDGDRPGSPCAHELIEAQAARTPDAVALIAGMEQLSFRDLDRRANRLAHRLRALGVGPEVRVGLAVDRSSDLVVGLLGILKAGGAYVPLDPGYPPDRLRYMVADSNARLVVTGDIIRASAVESAESPGIRVSPDHLAYVIYTSGSTGEPKGVAVSHRALAQHCESVGRRYGLESSDRVLQFSASSWDASLEQMLPTLITGATLVLRGPDVWTAAEFRHQMLQCGVTVANLPTAYADELIREWAANPGWAPAGGRFRLLVVGGEALRAETVRLWQQTPLRSLRFLNAYGPTETTITATAFEVPNGPDPQSGTVPIGRPLSGRTAYVLDRHRNPVPIGVAGELCLGGASLARGYLGRPALTAERFIPDPVGTTPGARLYRTGDWVRYLPEGDIEFHGRLDQQIKLRGYRIEPGEIEASLATHPAVRDSVVMLREDVPRDRRLVAYLVPADPAADPPATEALREHLCTRVPGYMVPSAFVWLTELPLTTQGKVDRQALPAPDPAGSGAAPAGGVAPRTPDEELLAGIWTEVLGLTNVGIHDDFFTLGGHSLLATQVISRIGRVFGVELPLSVLFEAPTLARLAERVEIARQRGAPSALVALQPRGSRRPLVLAHGAWGDLFSYRDLAARLGPDQPIYGFESPMGPNGAAALCTVEALAADYVRELRAFQPEGPYFLCGYCWAGGMAFEMGRQLQSAGQEVALLALIDSSCPGHRLPPQVRRRPKSRARDLWERTWRNLRRLGTLRPRAMPGFLGDRIGNLATELAGGLAFRLSLQLRRAVLPQLRTRYGALSHAGKLYRPQPYQVRVTLFRAHPKSQSNGDLHWGWDRVATGGVELCLLDGEHDTIMEDPQVDALASSLRACLERAQTR